MGRLAVYKFAYLLSIIFTFLILGLSVFAYFAGRIDPESNMFAAYIAWGNLYWSLSMPCCCFTGSSGSGIGHGFRYWGY